MSRHWLVLIVLLGRLLAPVSVDAQVPPAGTFGAGQTPINGVPFGPANSSALSDPSGQLNAARPPTLHTNPPLAAPPPQPVYRSVPSPERAMTPYASQRIFSADEVGSRKPPIRRRRDRGRTEVSHFTGICRGC